MAIEIKSNSEYKGALSDLPGVNAPMPDIASLYLDFKSGLYIAKNISTGQIFRTTLISDVLSFSRVSTKSVVGPYGVLQTVENGKPAIDYDPVTKKRRGITIHTSSSNKATYSEDFSQTAWSKTGCSITGNSANSPDGNNSATLLTEGTGNTLHTLEEVKATPTTVGQVHTFSVFVKKGTSKFVQLYAIPSSSSNTYANFDLENGVVTKFSANLKQAAIVAAPSGFFRISITMIVYAAYTSGGVGIAFIDDTINSGLLPSYTGTGKTLYVWGAQLEVMEAPTVYISTMGASYKREPDLLNANNSVTGFMSPSAGTIYVEALMPGVNQSPLGVLEVGNAFFGIESIDASLNYISFYQKNLLNNNGVVSATAYNAGANTSLDTMKGSAPAGRTYRGFISYDSENLRTYDEYGMTQVAAAMPASLFGRICIGRGRSFAKNPDSLWFNGVIQKIVYFPSLLTEEKIAELYDYGV